MKLGTETGSLYNYIYSRAVIGEPKIYLGLGATILGWTDRYPCTIVEIATKRNGSLDYIVVQEDDAKRIDKNGMSEDQTYEYTRNEDGRTHYYRKDKKGIWRSCIRKGQTGRIVYTRDNRGLTIGERDKYYDFSF